MQKFCFQLHETVFNKTSHTKPLSLRDQTSLTRSYPSISSSLLKTVLSSLVLIITITEAFVSLAFVRLM